MMESLQFSLDFESFVKALKLKEQDF
jgi:hypothetical protein